MLDDPFAELFEDEEETTPETREERLLKQVSFREQLEKRKKELIRQGKDVTVFRMKHYRDIFRR